MKYVTTIAEREFVIEILDDHHVALNGVIYNVDFESVSERTVYSLLVNNQSFEGSVYPSDEAGRCYCTVRNMCSRWRTSGRNGCALRWEASCPRISISTSGHPCLAWL